MSERESVVGKRENENERERARKRDSILLRVFLSLSLSHSIRGYQQSRVKLDCEVKARVCLQNFFSLAQGTFSSSAPAA